MSTKSIFRRSLVRTVSVLASLMLPLALLAAVACGEAPLAADDPPSTDAAQPNSPPPGIQTASLPRSAGNIPQGEYTLPQLKSWFDNIHGDPQIADMSELTTSALDETRNQIVLSVNCDSNRGQVSEAVQMRLDVLGIPVQAVDIEVMARAQALNEPLVFECIPSEVVDSTTGVSTPGFGGLYVESGVASVYLLRPSQKDGEELTLAQLGSESMGRVQQVRVLQGQYTWSQLVEWHELVKEEIMQLHASEMITVDPRKNRIVIEARRAYDDGVEEEIEEVLLRFAVPVEAVILLGLN